MNFLFCLENECFFLSKLFDFDSSTQSSDSINNFLPSLNRKKNHKNKFGIEIFFGCSDIKIPYLKIEGSKEPLNSNENNFLTVLTRLLSYVQGWDNDRETDKKFGSMAGNRRVSLLIISEMSCLSLDSKGKVFS